MKSRKKVIIVEGLIGSGKTTLSRELGHALDAMTLFEPDEKDEANPYLADYYGDAERWSLTMQVHLLTLRYRIHQHAQWHAMQRMGHVVIDRSLQGDTAFARLQNKLGLMTDREYDTYSRLYQAMTAHTLLPNVCIRILTNPKICNERIARRMETETGRRCETAIDVEYLKKLDEELDHMVRVLRAQGVTILDVPWDDDRGTPESRCAVVESLASRIEAMDVPDYFLDLHRRVI